MFQFHHFTNIQSDGDVADGDVFESTRMESGARGAREILKPEIYLDSEKRERFIVTIMCVRGSCINYS